MRRLRRWWLALTLFGHMDELVTLGVCACGCGKHLVRVHGETFTVSGVTDARIRKAQEARVA